MAFGQNAFLLMLTFRIQFLNASHFTSGIVNGEPYELVSLLEDEGLSNSRRLKRQDPICYKTKRSVARVEGVAAVRSSTTSRYNFSGTLRGSRVIIICEPQRPQKSGCYRTGGLMCCNKKLEHVMTDTIDKLKNDGKLKACNNQIIANALQAGVQAAFNRSFETVAAATNFAAKLHFHSNHLCKLKKEGRYMLAFGTPEPTVR